MSTALRDPSRPKVPDVLPLAVAYYAVPGNGAGGSLHVVLDDGNLEDVFVESARDWAAERGDEGGRILAELLLLMTRSQRGRVARGVFQEGRARG